jgi:hypothetical protein
LFEKGTVHDQFDPFNDYDQISSSSENVHEFDVDEKWDSGSSFGHYHYDVKYGAFDKVENMRVRYEKYMNGNRAPGCEPVTLKVSIIEGFDIFMNNENANPDPYVIVTVKSVPQTGFVSSAQHNTRNPNWNDEGQIEGYTAGNRLEFHVWDEDDPAFDTDDYMGFGTLQSRLFHSPQNQDGTDGNWWIAISRGGYIKVRVDIKFDLVVTVNTATTNEEWDTEGNKPDLVVRARAQVEGEWDTRYSSLKENIDRTGTENLYEAIWEEGDNILTFCNLGTDSVHLTLMDIDKPYEEITNGGDNSNSRDNIITYDKDVTCLEDGKLTGFRVWSSDGESKLDYKLQKYISSRASGCS